MNFSDRLPDDVWILEPSNHRSTEEDRQKEHTRQWVLHQLVETYKYPRDWLGTRIQLIDEEISQGFKGVKVTTKTGIPFLLISVEVPGQAKRSEESLRALLVQDEFSGMGLSSDGTKEGTVFLRKRFDTPKCEYITDLEPYTPPVTTRSSILYQNKNKSSLNTLSDKLENVFFEVHSHIRDIDGLHADEALDEFCKIIYAKLFDEEMTDNGEPFKLQRWIYGCAEELAATVRHLYEEANQYDVRVYGLRIPGYQRSRGVFDAPMRLSSPALARVVYTLQDYDLTNSRTDIKGRAFQKVLLPSVRAGMGQYFTPTQIVSFMVRVVNPQITDLILDPFAGSGHFLSTALDWVKHSNPKGSDKKLHEFAFGQLHGIEKSDRMVRIAMTDMRLHGDGHSNIRCTDALLAFSNYADLQPESFDVIISNPPFGSLLGREAVAQLGAFQLAENRKRVPLEVLGLERCFQFMRPGGRLGIVLPDGILGNRNTTYVRKWLEQAMKIRAIISLPVETFHPFGASIKTSILFARRWKSGERREENYPIFISQIDNVGYDASGRERRDPELEEIADKLATFFNEEGW